MTEGVEGAADFGRGAAKLKWVSWVGKGRFRVEWALPLPGPRGWQSVFAVQYQTVARRYLAEVDDTKCGGYLLRTDQGPPEGGPDTAELPLCPHGYGIFSSLTKVSCHTS